MNEPIDLSSAPFLSIFDLDHTLLTMNGSYYFGRYLYRKKNLSFDEIAYLAFCYFRHKAFGLPVRTLYSKVFRRLFLGRSMQEMRELADEYVNSLPLEVFHVEVMSRLESARNDGHELLILSSSPQFLVEAFAKRLGVSKSAGTELQVDHNGRMHTMGEVMEGKTKAFFVTKCSSESSIPFQNMTAYTDSVLDVPLLEVVGTGVGVNPDARLRKYCKEHGLEEIRTR